MTDELDGLLSRAHDLFAQMRPDVSTMEVFLHGLKTCRVALMAAQVGMDNQITPEEEKVERLQTVTVAGLFNELPVERLRSPMGLLRHDGKEMPFDITQVIAHNDTHAVVVIPQSPIGLAALTVDSLELFTIRGLKHQFFASLVEYKISAILDGGWCLPNVIQPVSFKDPAIVRVNVETQEALVQYSPHAIPITRTFSEMSNELHECLKKDYPEER